MARASAALRQFVLDPIAKRSPALLAWRLSQLLHERTNGRWDARILRLLAELHPKVALPPSPLIDEHGVATTVAALAVHGWQILPFHLPPDGIEEISRFAFSTPAYAHNPSERIPVMRDKPPREFPRYEWRIGELIRVPSVRALLSDTSLHRIAQDYLGCRPVLTSVTLWLDVIYDGDFDAHVYHYDNDGPAFLKFFIYLSDVDIDSGAHTYIKGSHSHMKPERFQRSQRYNRDELLHHYGTDSEIVFSAPAGTIIAEDTAGFHRGMNPKSKPRLLMQLEYAAIDIPHIEEFELGIPRVRISNLDPVVAKVVRKFAIPGV